MKAQGYITSTTGRGGSSLTKAGLVELGKQAEIGSCLFQPVSFSPRCPSAPLNLAVFAKALCWHSFCFC